MTNRKSTKRALLTSVLALLLCMAMLVGTTFAWFTDSVSTGVNTIQSGTLDVDIVDTNGNSLAGQTLSFKDVNGSTDILWEPGATFYLDTFQIVNKGNLALKYEVVISGLQGDAKLLEAIDFYAIIGGNQSTMAALTAENHLSAGESSPTIQIYGKMREEAGNEYQGLSIEGVSLTVVATQYTEEYDAFSNTYDAGAVNSTEIAELRQLLAAAKAGDTVTFDLTEDAYVDAPIRVPVGVNLVLNGNGHTMTLSLNKNTSGILAEGAGLTINDLTLTGTARMAIYTRGYRETVNGQMVENLVYPVLNNVTVDMDKAYFSPVYFNGMGEATLNNCTFTGAAVETSDYLNGAHVFAGAEMKVIVNGGNVGTVFINANGNSTTSIYASGITVNSGTVEKLILESDGREDQANNAAYTNVGGTVNEVVKVVDTDSELVNVLKEGYTAAMSRDITMEAYISASSVGNINIDGSGNTLTLQGIFASGGKNVTLSNVTLVDSKPDDYIVYNQGGKVELTNVTYSGNTNKAFQLAGGGEVILTDCNITGDVTGTYSASNIWCGDGRAVTVNGGTYGSIFMNVSEGANILSASKITVNDGTIGKLILETEKNTNTGDGMGYKSATLIQNGGTITEFVENPQGYDLTGLTKLN